MIINLAVESTLVSDTTAPDVPEQPIVVEDYKGSEGLSIVSWDGNTVYVPYRMVKEVCKVMTQYAKPKPKKK